MQSQLFLFYQDLVTIHHRSFLHHFISIPAAFISLRLFSKLFQKLLSKFKALQDHKDLAFTLQYIVVISWTSHQLRDGLRRGVSFYPFFITPPIPLQLYLALTVITPNLIHLSVHLIKKSDEQEDIPSLV